jgi:erythromycin esterase
VTGAAHPTEEAKKNKVTDWLRQSGIPLHVDVGQNADDLEPLKNILNGGAGDRSAVLTRLGSVMWDVEEFSDVLRWLRAHNESVPDAQKVRFYGADIFHTRVGRDRILAYLTRVNHEKVAATQTMFDEIAEAEARGLLVAHEHLGRGLIAQLTDLWNCFTGERNTLIDQTSVSEYEAIVRHLEVIVQWVLANSADELSPQNSRAPGLNIYARSQYMAENVIRFFERDCGQAKAVIWAHNLHISVGFEDPGRGPVANMGHTLRKHFADQYYSFGLELNCGTYLARQWLVPGRTLGDFTVGTIARARPGTLPWQLSQADGRNFMLNLRIPPQSLGIEQWLLTPQIMHCMGWAYTDPPLETEVVLKKHFDGMIFIESTTATTPTASAIQTVAQRAGH